MRSEFLSATSLFDMRKTGRQFLCTALLHNIIQSKADVKSSAVYEDGARRRNLK